MSELATITPEVQSSVRNIMAVLGDLDGLTVRNDAENQRAGDLARRITTARKEGEAQLKQLLEPIKESEKRTREFFRVPLEQLSNGEQFVKGKIGAYLQNQERIRQEAARKAAEQAEKERRERESIAEAHRLKAAAAETEADRARYEAFAEAQEEKAANIVPMAPPPAAKVEGISMRDNWSASVENLRALVDAVAEGKVDIEAILPNQTYLNGLARALKTGMKIPGVRAVNAPSVAAGRF